MIWICEEMRQSVRVVISQYYYLAFIIIVITIIFIIIITIIIIIVIIIYFYFSMFDRTPEGMISSDDRRITAPSRHQMKASMTS